MNETEMRRVLIEELVRIAPDLDPAAIRDDDHLRKDLELDSMDFLNLVAALDARLGVAVQEPDYPRLATLATAVPYLAERSLER